MPIALPPVVLAHFVWVRGNLGRARATFVPLFPIFNVFQLECACMQQRLVESQELLAVL